MTTQIRLFEVFQPKVNRGTAKTCQICGYKFNAFAPEHQCKRCLRAVCGGCGTTKRDVYKPKMTRKPHRLCKICAFQSTLLIEYIAANKLVFGEDSEISKKWHSKIPKNIKRELNTKQQRKFTVQIFNQLWDAYNFSLRQFIGLLTYSMGQADVYKLINTVYIQLQSRGVQQKLQNVILIIIFVLCFSNTETCANLVEYLCGLRKAVTDQKQMLQTYTKALGIAQSQYKKLSDYTNFKIKQFIGSMSVNATTAQCSIFVISKAFEKQRIDEAFMTLAIMIQDNWDSLIKNRTNKNQCQYLIIKNCSMGNYSEKYKMLVPVKVSHFTLPTRASLKTIQTNDNEGVKRMQSIKIEDGTDSPPQKPSFEKKLSLQQSFDITQFDQINNDGRKFSLKPIEARKEEEQQESEKQGKLEKNDLLTGIFAGLAKGADKSMKQSSKLQKQQKVQQVKNFHKQPLKKQLFLSFVQKMPENTSKPVQNSQFKAENKQLNKITNDRQKQTKKQNHSQNQNQNDIFDDESSQDGNRNVKRQQIPQNIKSKIKSKNQDPIVYYQKQHCQQCAIKAQKLQQLEQQLLHKRQQFEGVAKELKVAQNHIQALKIQLAHLKQQDVKQKQTDDNKIQIQKLKKQLNESTQKFNSVMKDVFKFQKQNKILKNQLQDMGINNSLLKSKLEEKSLGIGSSSKTSQKQEELTRMNQLMKKNIENKNKQLQALQKKNKQLSIQFDQLSKAQSNSNLREQQRFKKLEKQNKELMQKLKQLGNLVLNQEQEKLSLSSQLFEIRRQSTLSISQPKAQDSKQPTTAEQSSIDGLKKRASQCLIF